MKQLLKHDSKKLKYVLSAEELQEKFGIEVDPKQINRKRDEILAIEDTSMCSQEIREIHTEVQEETQESTEIGKVLIALRNQTKAQVRIADALEKIAKSVMDEKYERAKKIIRKAQDKKKQEDEDEKQN